MFTKIENDKILKQFCKKKNPRSVHAIFRLQFTNLTFRLKIIQFFDILSSLSV